MTYGMVSEQCPCPGGRHDGVKTATERCSSFDVAFFSRSASVLRGSGQEIRLAQNCLPCGTGALVAGDILPESRPTCEGERTVRAMCPFRGGIRPGTMPAAADPWTANPQVGAA